jgi:glucose-6-phosphate isomerase
MGTEVACQTGPIYWGEPGTNGQHSFYQLIHQGTKLIPCDFIGFAPAAQPSRPPPRLAPGQRVCPGGGAGLWQNVAGGPAEGTPPWLVPHRTFEGNRPSSTILLERLTPAALGKLVALYEHSVFTQGAIWNIDSFDQWGVELGKALAARIIPELESRGKCKLKHDSSTNTLIRRYRSQGAVHGSITAICRPIYSVLQRVGWHLDLLGAARRSSSKCWRSVMRITCAGLR